MRIDILTLFPDVVRPYFGESIIKRAVEDGKVEIFVHNFRDYSLDKNKKVDDTPYGGGQGMVLMAQPIFDCVEALRCDDSIVILLTPDGEVYNQKIAESFKVAKHLILICGHYEGFDERIRSICDREISIGDYVLTGGEVPALVLVDSIVRLIDGVIREESHLNESFQNKMLDYPVYTKPADFRGMKVPEVLLSGNHQKIDEYRREMMYNRTKERRPDLLK